MPTVAEIKAAYDAAVVVLEEADFRIVEGVAWAEPGDLQAQGFDLRALVTAALKAARGQCGE